MFILLVLILQLTCFICITLKRKQTMEQQPHHALWMNEIKQKQQKKSGHIQTDHSFLDLAQKQYSDTIKGWLHCLTSESKGIFLASNILLAWCLAMAQPPLPPTVSPYSPSKWTSYVYHPYSELWHIHNQRHIHNPGTFRTLSNMCNGKFCKKS